MYFKVLKMRIQKILKSFEKHNMRWLKYPAALKYLYVFFK